MRQTTVFRRADAGYVYADSLTTTGLWVTSPPYFKIELKEEPWRIGKAIVDALQASRVQVPHPIKWDLFLPVLRLAGVRSWRAFAKNARALDIKVTGEWMVFQPYKNEEPKKGFTPILGKEFRIPLGSSAEEIADAVQRAIELCE